MSRGAILVGILLVLWTITASATVGATTVPSHSTASVSSIGEVEYTTGLPDQFEGNEALFKKVEENNSSFVVKVNLSLFTTLFQQGSVLRIVTGGTANGERVVWFDIGIGRGPDGFEVRSEATINLPYM